MVSLLGLGPAQLLDHLYLVVEHAEKFLDHFVNGNVELAILGKIILAILYKIRNNFISHRLMWASSGGPTFRVVLDFVEGVDVVGLQILDMAVWCISFKGAHDCCKGDSFLILMEEVFNRQIIEALILDLLPTSSLLFASLLHPLLLLGFSCHLQYHIQVYAMFGVPFLGSIVFGPAIGVAVVGHFESIAELLEGGGGPLEIGGGRDGRSSE